MLRPIFSIIMSPVGAKILYGLILSYKAATVYGWLVSLLNE